MGNAPSYPFLRVPPHDRYTRYPRTHCLGLGGDSVQLHYNRRAAAFDEFEKAHLKLPEHRYLIRAEYPALPLSNIGRQSVALPHIEPLWAAS